MTINVLRYKREHVKTFLEYLSVLELDKSLWTANISYSIALRVFEQIRFLLDRNTYYNIRSRVTSIKQNEFAVFVVVLEKTGFIFKCRIKKEFDLETDIVINRQLQQIWFVHPQQIRYT